MKYAKSLFTLLIILFLTTLEAKPPKLTPHDAHTKIEEILRAHAAHQKLSPELIGRSLTNYIDELDPGKTYFLKEDIQTWLTPSDHLLNTTVEQINAKDFTIYEKIHEVMISAIARHNALEGKIDNKDLPSDVKSIEFKDMTWADSEAELLTRLTRIRALQLEAVEKLGHQTKEEFTQRLNKRRYAREEELITSSETTRKQVILSYALKAISSSLDSQTNYFTPSEASQFMIQVQQRLYGIGAQLQDDLSGFSIMRLLEGGPALEGKQLKVGDRIIAVNKEAVVGMELIDAVELIRGPEGTKVTLTVIRPKSEDGKEDQKLDIIITRSEVVLKETRFDTAYEPFGNGVIGYLHLHSFYQDASSSSATDLEKAINKMKQEHPLKGIVLDLRNNGGGLLPQAVAVTGLFIKKGVVVSVKDNTHEIQRLRTIEANVAWNGPLIVLTNRTSASAAEIVAQTLQDYGRALIVGDSETYGKGTFQTFTLEAANFGKVNPKGEFKVTRGRYYTVSGKSPQLIGVKPEIIVPGIFSELEIGERHSKFPLPSDEIEPSFVDDLSDIPPFQRSYLSRLYKFDLQEKIDLYAPYLETLRENSAKRIQLNANYQTFLKELKKEEASQETMEQFGQNDLQKQETMNIMKDLLILLQEDLSKASSPSDKAATAAA